ncbi:HAD family hydrolase [Pelagibacterium luteolum]|uniref:Haloacid dehalogenase superfamily, subfamily IA, variant 3 with third motif having DD or ED n=1 Tax=Pelagibacterium luteolum TaxID=440168 RepID=A0A1G7SR29_9HYPH|nr:HAD family phosphatase [Pelagibacterium luteolum]SDG25421.1 haloacid dehalogenase superfamily, subfamily IA, variant 3 with third motif having DD or ED [Pelagibacterium luteolum]
MIALSHPFDAVIFDMDGTLLDTEAAFRTIVFEVCTEMGFEMTSDVHGRIVGSSHEATAQLLVETFGDNFDYENFDAKCRATMHVMLADNVPVKAGAVELLGALKALDIPLAVATSSRANHAMSHLDRAGVLPFFDTIVTRDDVVHPKPHPEPYLMAAERLGVAPEHCVAFEDSFSGVRAAHAAGMRTVMVPDLVTPSDDVAALCVAVLESLAHAHDHLVAAPRASRHRLQAPLQASEREPSET